jgi:hypothetical protein
MPDHLYSELAARRPTALRLAVTQRARALANALLESAAAEGIYYCTLDPGGWDVFAYRFDDFPEADHSVIWTGYVAPVLAARWARPLRLSPQVLETRLAPLVYAFPRGRVARPVIGSGRFVVYYGQDLPPGITRSKVNNLFGLPVQVKWEPDDHEHCLTADRDAACRLLKVEAAWPAD